MQLPPAEQSLEAAEGLYEQKDFDGAEKSFKQVYEQTETRSARLALPMDWPDVRFSSSGWARLFSYLSARLPLIPIQP